MRCRWGEWRWDRGRTTDTRELEKKREQRPAFLFFFYTSRKSRLEEDKEEKEGRWKDRKDIFCVFLLLAELRESVSTLSLCSSKKQTFFLLSSPFSTYAVHASLVFSLSSFFSSLAWRVLCWVGQWFCVWRGSDPSADLFLFSLGELDKAKKLHRRCYCIYPYYCATLEECLEV